MRIPRLFFVNTLIAISLAIPSLSIAGSICGTVRDVTNNLPVPQAALFLFDNANQYTGLYDDTDSNGQYCINNVPAGTYTLQVRVDDYLVKVVPGIEVTQTTGVDVDLTPRFALQQPWPNPASTQVTFQFVAPPDTQVELDVFDVAGRRVYGWKGRAGTNGGRTIEWNLRDFNGSELQSGIYFVRLHAADATLVRRFVRLR
jgi:hypothetical protein